MEHSEAAQYEETQRSGGSCGEVVGSMTQQWAVWCSIMQFGVVLVVIVGAALVLSPFLARSWPDDVHATFIHNIQRKGEDRIGWRRSLVYTICATTTTYHHHYPPNSYRLRGGRRKVWRKKMRKFSHTLIHAHSGLDQ